jgi:predicted phage-related endonuclease
MQVLFHAKEFVQTDALSYSDWLQYRRNGIGGSDLAAICGISKYKTLLNVYLEKLGEAPEDTMSEAAE